jgi:hypothetical protein
VAIKLGSCDVQFGTKAELVSKTRPDTVDRGRFWRRDLRCWVLQGLGGHGLQLDSGRVLYRYRRDHWVRIRPAPSHHLMTGIHGNAWPLECLGDAHERAGSVRVTAI